MSDVHDIGLNSDFDLDAKDGDFTTVESTGQHQQLLLLTAPGEWKEHPATGVGAFWFLDDEGAGAVIREIVQGFMADGMEMPNNEPNPAAINNSQVKVYEEAYYK